jgi:hypothetical protein
MISVIVPIHRRESRLQSIRTAISSSSIPAELVIVINNKELEGSIVPLHSHERIVVSKHMGRGHSFVEGIKEARGYIILLLHSDTVLPVSWDVAIADGLEDTRTVAGGFSRSFDRLNPYLRVLVNVSELLAKLTGEIWGDRGVFMRSEVARQCLSAIDVPILEDVRLSKCLNRLGKVILLKEKTVTSSEAFRKKGMIKHLLSIVKCRLWYTLGGQPRHIYKYYYRRG